MAVHLFALYRGLLASTAAGGSKPRLTILWAVCQCALLCFAIVRANRGGNSRRCRNEKQCSHPAKHSHRRFQRKQPVVAKEKTNGCKEKNQWFHRRKPVVSKKKTSGLQVQNLMKLKMKLKMKMELELKTKKPRGQTRLTRRTSQVL